MAIERFIGVDLAWRDESVAAIREDRILDEAHATGGDVRRLADLFGLSMQAGTCYTGVLGHPELTSDEHA